MSLARAWALLAAASAATTALAFAGATGPWVPAALLALALFKARLILAAYLRLDEAPAILRGFSAVFAAWAGLALVLALAA